MYTHNPNFEPNPRWFDAEYMRTVQEFNILADSTGMRSRFRSFHSGLLARGMQRKLVTVDQMTHFRNEAFAARPLMPVLLGSQATKGIYIEQVDPLGGASLPNSQPLVVDRKILDEHEIHQITSNPYMPRTENTITLNPFAALVGHDIHRIGLQPLKPFVVDDAELVIRFAEKLASI